MNKEKKKKSKSKKADSFLKDGLSIDEAKVSILMLTYFIGFIVFLVLVFLNGDIESVKSMLMTLIAAITGVNIINHGLDCFKSSDHNKKEKNDLNNE